MKPEHKQLVDQRLQYFDNDVIPCEILPRLDCLTVGDAQQIKCDEDRKGPKWAMMTLMDRLKRRPDGFYQLVLALREEGLGHVALLLDANYSVTDKDRVDNPEDTRTFYKIGSAVDLRIPGRIFKPDREERYLDLEKHIATEFGKPSSEEAKALRKAFRKVLPQGIEFVFTKQMGGPLHTGRKQQGKQESSKVDEASTNGVPEEKETEIVENVSESNASDSVEIDEAATNIVPEEKGTEVVGNVSESNASDSVKIDEAEINGGSEKETEVVENGKRASENSHEGSATGQEHAQDNDTAAADQSSCYQKDSVVTVFRLASVKAVEEFKEMWDSKRFQELMQEFLVTKTLETKDATKQLLPLELRTHYLEEDCKKIKQLLQDADSEQDLEKTGDDLLFIREDDDNSHVTDPLDEEIHIKIPPVYLEWDGHVALPHDLNLRRYQQELAEPALQGNNTIICAPTNSGKTFVAMEIAKKHLDEHSTEKGGDRGAALEIPDDIEGPKVIFIVSTQNLVLQQRSRFESYLSNYAVSDISGVNSTEIPLEFLLKANDVVVLTAQILMNALERKNSCLKLSHISLLIFDECHHTQKDHAYNKIMQRYMDMKLGQADQQRKLPQVVGLTASLGVGKSNTVENAIKHMMQLCANLDVVGITTVRENSQELLDSVSGEVPARKVIRVESSTATSPFHKAFDQVMSKIETAAHRLLETLPSPPQNRLSQQYRQWIETVTKQACLLGSRQLSTYIEQLKWYHIALQNNDCVRMKDAMNSLDEYFNGLDESKFTKYEQMLKTLFQKGKAKVENYVAVHGESVNPKLETLKDLILAENAKGNGKSKGILFSRTRVSTVGLEEWINETEELKHVFRPKALVGGGDGDVGMSQGEQEQIIADFQKGVVNILIATTVAEEGLDISDCSYVIRYDMMGNEISSTQSRGRIRAKDGTYAYVADARSKGHEREKLNQYRELLMIDAVAKVQSLDANDYANTIKKLQLKSAFDRKLKIATMKKNSHQQQVVDVEFHCRKCHAFACEAKHLRCVMGSHHIVIDQDFRLNKMEVRPHRKPKLVDGITMDNKVHCKKCGEDWGVTAKIYGKEWPVLKICSFVLKSRDGKRKMYRKWCEAGLNIPEVDSFAEVLEAEELPECLTSELADFDVL